MGIKGGQREEGIGAATVGVATVAGDVKLPNENVFGPVPAHACVCTCKLGAEEEPRASEEARWAVFAVDGG